MTRRNRDADLLAHRLDRAATTIPQIFEHLNEQRTLIGVSGGSGGGVQPGTHSDPTLAVVARLDAVDGRRRAILDALASINVGVNLLEEACADALRMRARPAERSETASEPKCAGGDPSTWGAPTCGELVDWKLGDNGHVSLDRDGLCVKHRRACDEWTKRAAESNGRRIRRHRATDAA